MELYKEILVKVLGQSQVEVTFSGVKLDMAKIIEEHSYSVLQKIKTIIEDDSLSDFECIEAIVCIFEDIGSSGGSRHDF